MSGNFGGQKQPSGYNNPYQGTGAQRPVAGGGYQNPIYAGSSQRGGWGNMTGDAPPPIYGDPANIGSNGNPSYQQTLGGNVGSGSGMNVYGDPRNMGLQPRGPAPIYNNPIVRNTQPNGQIGAFNGAPSGGAYGVPGYTSSQSGGQGWNPNPALLGPGMGAQRLAAFNAARASGVPIDLTQFDNTGMPIGYGGQYTFADQARARGF